MHPIYRARPSFCANLNLLAHSHGPPPPEQILDHIHSPGADSNRSDTPSTPSRRSAFPYLLSVPDQVYVPVDSSLLKTDSCDGDGDFGHPKKYQSVPLSVHYRMYYRKIITTENYGAETNYSHHPSANDDVEDSYDQDDNNRKSTPVCLEPRSQGQTLDDQDDDSSSSSKHTSSPPPSPCISSGSDSLTLSVCSDDPHTPETPSTLLLSPYPNTFGSASFCAPTIRSFF